MFCVRLNGFRKMELLPQMRGVYARVNYGSSKTARGSQRKMISIVYFIGVIVGFIGGFAIHKVISDNCRARKDEVEE